MGAVAVAVAVGQVVEEAGAPVHLEGAVVDKIVVVAEAAAVTGAVGAPDPPSIDLGAGAGPETLEETNDGGMIELDHGPAQDPDQDLALQGDALRVRGISRLPTGLDTLIIVTLAVETTRSVLGGTPPPFEPLHKILFSVSQTNSHPSICFAVYPCGLLLRLTVGGDPAFGQQDYMVTLLLIYHHYVKELWERWDCKIERED